MNKKKYWLPVTFILIFILLLVIIFYYFSSSLNSKLPIPPDYSKLLEAQLKQIKEANKEAGKNYNSDNLGNLGMIYHSNTFYEEAKESYLKAIEADSSDWRWYYYLGYLHSELGESEKVITYLKKVSEINPVLDYASYYLAEAYVNVGQNDEAEKIYTGLSLKDTDAENFKKIRSNIFPLNAYAQFRLARLYLTASDLDKSMVVLRNLTEEYPDFGPGFRLLATIYSQQGKEDLSNENNIRATELIPFTAPLDTLIDELALISQSPEYVMKQIDITSISNPYWSKLLFERAYITMSDNAALLSKGIKLYLKMGVVDNTVEKLNKHIQVYSKDFNELQTVATIAFRKSYYKLASIYYEKCLTLKPEDFTSKFRFAMSQLKLNKAKESIDLFDKLFEENPDSLKILTAQVTAYLTLNDQPKALDVVNKLESISPDFPDVDFLRAKIAVINGDKKKADEYFLRAYQKIPDDVEIIQYIGQMYIEQKLWEKSINHYKNALSVLPVEAAILEEIGDLYLNCPETKFRNTGKAKYYTERAFYSLKSSLQTKISAGKNLSNLYASEGNINKALRIITLTLNMAQSARLPEAEIKEIKSVQQIYNSMSGFQ